MTPRPSIVWAHFTKKPGYIATCKACQKDLSYKTSVSNLGKHWRRKHGNGITRDLSDTDCDTSDGEQEKNIPEKKPTATWNYFQAIDSDKYEATCKICNESVPYDSVSDLKKHVEDHGEEPKDSDDEYVPELLEKSNGPVTTGPRRHSKLWKYFKILDDSTAVCVVCRGMFKYSSTISNLRKHLQKKHPELDLSQDDKGKKIIISTNGQLYEVETEEPDNIEHDDEKPMEMNAIYLEDLDDTEDLPPPRPRKNQSKIIFKRDFHKEQLKRSLSNNKPLKRNRDSCSVERERPTPTVTSTSLNTSNTMESLDYFGQYIVSLLKGLPKSVSDQLQSEIVNQILTSKMALQTQTTAAAKYEIRVSRSDENVINVPEPVSYTVVESNEVPEKANDITENVVQGQQS